MQNKYQDITEHYIALITFEMDRKNYNRAYDYLNKMESELNALKMRQKLTSVK